MCDNFGFGFFFREKRVSEVCVEFRDKESFGLLDGG
jgi:hypothetical protein